jgi:hypothetical protein
LSVVSCQLSVVSCQLSVVSCQLSVVSCQLSVVSCQLSVVSFQFGRAVPPTYPLPFILPTLCHPTHAISSYPRRVILRPGFGRRTLRLPLLLPLPLLFAFCFCFSEWERNFGLVFQLDGRSVSARNRSRSNPNSNHKVLRLKPGLRMTRFLRPELSSSKPPNFGADGLGEFGRNGWAKNQNPGTNEHLPSLTTEN